MLCSIKAILLLTGCTGQGTSSLPGNDHDPGTPVFDPFTHAAPTQISQYIRRMFQDEAGNIWFGTNGDGVCKYDGKTLAYFLNGTAVRGMVQDARGDLWFATSDGVFRMNSSIPLSENEDSFIHYSTKDGLADNEVWSILLDRKGGLWFGTQEGVSRFDPTTSTGKGEHAFTTFTIPPADHQRSDVYPYPKLINCIMQDKAGDIWCGSNGGGVYRYDGKKLRNLSEHDGLCNNYIQTIIQDQKGTLWFGSRFGGMSAYDGRSFTTYTTAEGLANDFVWTLFEDKAGVLWIASAGGGLCRMVGGAITCFSEAEGLGNRHVQSLLEDEQGQLWVGTSGGVYRFDGPRLWNWTKEDAVQGR